MGGMTGKRWEVVGGRERKEAQGGGPTLQIWGWGGCKLRGKGGQQGEGGKGERWNKVRAKQLLWCNVKGCRVDESR